ncbi:MAG: beta strand repeat-containing protein [Opitutaceae bacterium]
MKYTVLLITFLLGILSPTVHAVEVANAAADYQTAPDYVAGTTAPSAPPAGWEYIYADTVANAATAGTALTPQTATGNEGNAGFAYDPGANNVPSVLGGITGANDFEIFNNATNSAVVGADLVLHPGNNASYDVVAVRYTLSAADITNGTSATITGSFRRGNNGGNTGVLVSVYHNSTSLWTVDSNDLGGTALPQVDGTFSLVGVSVAEGDTISFILDAISNNYNGDESALQASIDLEPAPVNDPPTIVTDPVTPQDLFVGDALSLSVAASGSPTLTYQWRKDTVDIGGATSATFDIASVVVGDTASYDCVVTNGFGSATSAASVVTVTVEPPVITTQPIPQTLAVGQTLILTVVAESTEPMSYQWAKDFVDIVGATSDTYTIPSVVLGDAGEYDVRVTNSGGDTFSDPTTTITVVDNDAPVSSAPDVSTTENVTLTLLVDDLATDADLNPLTITSADATSVNGAAISFHGTKIAYFPGSGTVTDDTFTCEVSDGYVTTTVTVTIDVLAGSTTVVANPALDYVDGITMPAQWSYLGSDLATGGTEFALTSIVALANGGNTGFGQVGASFDAPGVLGSIDGGAQYEIFGDGFDGNLPNVESGNEGLPGVDLLMAPGSAATNTFAIARYTIGEEIVSGTTATISGSFRELVVHSAAKLNANNGGSVDVFVYHNSTVIFDLDRANDIANGGMLTQLDGTFSITGLTVAYGDTISFVVGNNGNFSGDETALQALIELSGTPGVVPGYSSWLDGFPGLSDTSPGGDPDSDGIETLMEYVLDGDPGVADTSILPTGGPVGADWVFTFTRREESADDTIQVFQFTDDLLSAWVDVTLDSGTPPAGVTVDLGTASGGLQDVTVTIDSSLITDRGFGRLSVTQP